ncbi:unnamed protein product, partial [Ectocarpus sp. 12 AP-2014]
RLEINGNFLDLYFPSLPRSRRGRRRRQRRRRWPPCVRNYSVHKLHVMSRHSLRQNDQSTTYHHLFSKSMNCWMGYVRCCRPRNIHVQVTRWCNRHVDGFPTG